MRRVPFPSPVLLILLFALFALSGCAGRLGPPPLSASSAAVCRPDVVGAPGGAASAVSWIRPDDAEDRARHDAWCAAVGVPTVLDGIAGAAATPNSDIDVVSWNVHVGGGDIEALVTAERRRQEASGHPAELILLLQEVHRTGPPIPDVMPYGAEAAGRIAPAPADGERLEIEAIAERLGMWLFYVPSMRNGDAPDEAPEDRGNAILSTVPLAELTAIELPFEGQRRVAVAATLQGSGDRPPLRLVSGHLDTRGGADRLWWALGPLGRARQAAALVRAIASHEALVVGADLNTWFGSREEAYALLRRALPLPTLEDLRPTLWFPRVRLDHLFFKLPDRWQAGYTRLDDRYGSDHYPLRAWISGPDSLRSFE